MSEHCPYPFSHVEEALAILNQISILAGLSDKQLHSVFQQLNEVSYGAGEVIFEQGSQPSHIYIVLKGRVKLVVSDGGTSLELIEFVQGDCFGETSVIGIQPHEATAVAAGRTDLLVLSREALLAFYQTDVTLFSVLILNIAREACRRLSRTDQILLHYVLDETP